MNQVKGLSVPSKRVLDAMSDILNYNWVSEEDDYTYAIAVGDIEPAPGSGHVFEALTIVRAYLDGSPVMTDVYVVTAVDGTESVYVFASREMAERFGAVRFPDQERAGYLMIERLPIIDDVLAAEMIAEETA